MEDLCQISSNQVMNRTCVDVVMLIDDNEIDTFINGKIIELNYFSDKLMTYKSAGEALEYLKTSELHDIPDLIFLDLNMPVIDGFRFLFEFSKFSDEVREKANIVVLTSSENFRDKEKIEANSDVIQFLSKPLNESKLAGLRVLLEVE